MSSVPPDFWSVVGQTELDVFVSIAAGRLSQDLDHLIEDFRKHHHASVAQGCGAPLSTMRHSSVPGIEGVPMRARGTAADRLLGELESLAGGKTPATPGKSSGIRRAPRLRPRAASV